jgi:hypothetical protein
VINAIMPSPYSDGLPLMTAIDCIAANGASPTSLAHCTATTMSAGLPLKMPLGQNADAAIVSANCIASPMFVGVKMPVLFQSDFTHPTFSFIVQWF